MSSNWKTFICQNESCGKEFEKYAGPNGNRKGTKYCSLQCSAKARTILPIFQKKCKKCGILYETKREKQLYCSTECAANHSGYTINDSSRMGGPREGGGKSSLLPYRNIHGETMKLNSEEIILARYLDKENFRWRRNLTYGFSYLTENGKTRLFYPDFYIEEQDIYVEYKGWITDEMQHKMQNAVKTNSNLRLCIVVGADKRYLHMGIPMQELLDGNASLEANV